MAKTTKEQFITHCKQLRAAVIDILSNEDFQKKSLERLQCFREHDPELARLFEAMDKPCEDIVKYLESKIEKF